MDLLSDFQREVSRRYGTLLEDKFFSQRAYVLIDRAGIVRWIDQAGNYQQRSDPERVLAAIRSTLG